MTTNVWVEQEWADHKLKWDPDEYGGVSKLHVPSDQLWLVSRRLRDTSRNHILSTLSTLPSPPARHRVVQQRRRELRSHYNDKGHPPPRRPSGVEAAGDLQELVHDRRRVLSV